MRRELWCARDSNREIKKKEKKKKEKKKKKKKKKICQAKRIRIFEFSFRGKQWDFLEAGRINFTPKVLSNASRISKGSPSKFISSRVNLINASR